MVPDLCQALLEFKNEINQSWILERHGYLTPGIGAEVAVERLAEPA